MISFRDSACEIVKSQNLKWSDLLTDEVHPNAKELQDENTSDK